MNEAQVNGTRDDEDRTEEAQVVDDAGDDGSVDVELLRRARLSAMLRELVRQEGPRRLPSCWASTTRPWRVPRSRAGSRAV